MNNKQKKVLIPLIAIGVVISLGYEGFGWDKFINEFAAKDLVVADFNTKKMSGDGMTITNEAWQVVEEYLGYTKAHDLEGVKKLTYKISDTCADMSKEKECFALMDSVSIILGQFKIEDFKNVLWDENRITLFTDYQDGTRTAVYFTRDTSGVMKISGMRFCFNDASGSDDCSSL